MPLPPIQPGSIPPDQQERVDRFIKRYNQMSQEEGVDLEAVPVMQSLNIGGSIVGYVTGANLIIKINLQQPGNNA